MSMIKSKCPAFEREKKIREIMSTFNSSYKVALDILQERNYKEGLHNQFHNSLENQNTLKTNENGNHVTKNTYASVVKPSLNIIEEESNTEESATEVKSIKRKSSKKLPKRKKTQKEKKQLNLKNTEEYNSNIASHSNSDHSEDESINKKKKKIERTFTVKLFLEKMKYIIMSESDVQDKVYDIIRYILKAIISSVGQFINTDMLKSLFWNVISG